MEEIYPEYRKKSIFQQKISKKATQCLICEHKCKITNGKTGRCQTRYNKNGKIYTIIFGCIPAISCNAIEKKPLYHFYPGTQAYTVGSYGCNFNCFWCQNFRTVHPNEDVAILAQNEENFLSPAQFIENALNQNCQGTSISFNEPTLLTEYSFEVFKLAKKEGLYNTFVSNGYMTSDTLNLLIDAGLNAINVDIKGDQSMVQKYCGADVEKVWRNTRIAKERGVHVEITTLLIQGFNSDPEIVQSIARRIKTDLGEDTPFHISRFFPYYKSSEQGLNKPTPLKSLYKAFKTAKREGLYYVYLGNVSNSKYSRTICPNCSEIVIERDGFGRLGIKELNIDKEGKCSNCGVQICIY